MGAILSYSLGVSVFLLFGYLAYKLFMAGEKQPALNRALLISIYLVSLVAIPLLAMEWGRSEPVNSGTIELGAIAVSVIPTEETESTMVIPRLILALYVAGMAVTALISAVGVIKLLLLLRQGKRITKNGYTLVQLPHCEVPFSFGRYIVVGEDEKPDTLALIEAHEKAHLQSRHWLDLILAQAVCILLWYNPVAWLMREELRQVHEYQADAKVLSQGFDPYTYQMLLIKKAAGRRLQSLANSLNHSNLSKRITMMYKTENRALRSMRALALLPAIVLAALAVEQPAVATTIKEAGAASLLTPAEMNQPVVECKVSENLSVDQFLEETEESESTTEIAQQPLKGEPVKITEPQKQEEPLKAVKKMPQFPGGDMALMEFLMKNVRYPQDAMEAGKEGMVVVSFTIAEDGAVQDPQIRRSQGESLDAEALRVVNILPNFEPGINEEGKAVACRYTIPVNFRLTKKEKGTAKEGQEEGKVTVAGFRNTGKKATVATSDNLAVCVNGEPFNGDIKSIPAEKIESMDIIKNNPDYPNGVIMIQTKE